MTAVPKKLPDFVGYRVRHTPESQRCKRELLELSVSELGEHDIYKLGEVIADHLDDVRRGWLASACLRKMFDD
jgi:hypothetical protein